MEKVEQGKGTADHLMPLGYLFILIILPPFFSSISFSPFFLPLSSPTSSVLLLSKVLFNHLPPNRKRRRLSRQPPASQMGRRILEKTEIIGFSNSLSPPPPDPLLPNRGVFRWVRFVSQPEQVTMSYESQPWVELR